MGMWGICTKNKNMIFMGKADLEIWAKQLVVQGLLLSWQKFRLLYIVEGFPIVSLEIIFHYQK